MAIFTNKEGKTLDTSKYTNLQGQEAIDWAKGQDLFKGYTMQEKPAQATTPNNVISTSDLTTNNNVDEIKSQAAKQGTFATYDPVTGMASNRRALNIGEQGKYDYLETPINGADYANNPDAYVVTNKDAKTLYGFKKPVQQTNQPGQPSQSGQSNQPAQQEQPKPETADDVWNRYVAQRDETNKENQPLMDNVTTIQGEVDQLKADIDKMDLDNTLDTAAIKKGYYDEKGKIENRNVSMEAINGALSNLVDNVNESFDKLSVVNAVNRAQKVYDYNSKLIELSVAQGKLQNAQSIAQQSAQDFWQFQNLKLNYLERQDAIDQRQLDNERYKNDLNLKLVNDYGYTPIENITQELIDDIGKNNIYTDSITGKSYIIPDKEKQVASYQTVNGDLVSMDSKGNIIRNYGKADNLSVNDILAVLQAGYTFDNSGNIVSSNSTTVVSPSGHTYDNSTYAADPVAHTNAINNIIESIGTVDNLEDLQDYISFKNPNSTITADMISNASMNYGVGWEELTAYIQHESILGTSNVAVKNNNPGGITWSQSYQDSHPGVSKGTSRPASEGGNYVKFDTMQDGVNAVAEQLQRRQTDTSTSNTTFNIDPSSESILAQTGLSVPVFGFLTQGNSALTRLSAEERQKIWDEADNWLNSQGVDLSTFQSRYKAYNEVVQSNIERFNRTVIMEGELNGTIENLTQAADDASFGDMKLKNVAKLLAGQEFNDENVAKYAFHLNQIKSEIAGYNAAVQGRTQAQEIDYEEADRIIKSGLAQGTLEGFKQALAASVSKMDNILAISVDSANKQVWDLFGVGDNYQSQFKEEEPNFPVDTNVDSSTPISSYDFTIK